MSDPVRGTLPFAEIAFAKGHSQLQARTRAYDEHNSALSERTEITQRLRLARLAREALVKRPAPGRGKT